MELVTTIYFSALIVIFYMTALFILAMILKDNSIADIAWGPGFILIAWAAMYMNSAFGTRQIMAAVLVTVWGLRLGIRILRRNAGRGEDPRYKKWRQQWGRYFVIRSYLQVFVLQGFILLLNVIPVMVIMSSYREDLSWPDCIGLAIWCAGFFFETVGDYQLDVFVRDPGNRGKIIGRGLWKYTRHPNYFGEVTMWWGIFIIALTGEWGWAGIIGPAVITAMIVFVSGIPMTEKMMKGTPGWEEYRNKTSVLIPWFPRKV